MAGGQSGVKRSSALVALAGDELETGFAFHYELRMLNNIAMGRKRPPDVEFYVAEDFDHFLLDAKQGDANAQVTLSFMYCEGAVVKKDAAEAAKRFRKAAEQGDAIPRCLLGVLYKRGDGVKKNVTEALEWLRLAADQGDYLARYILGCHYAQGNGVEQDCPEAQCREPSGNNLCHLAGSFGGWRRCALVTDRNGSAPRTRLASHQNPCAILVSFIS